MATYIEMVESENRNMMDYAEVIKDIFFVNTYAVWHQAIPMDILLKHFPPKSKGRCLGRIKTPDELLPI